MTEQDPRPQVIQPVGIPSQEAVGTPTAWLTYSFAPEWFSEALHEARSGSGPASRRREIVFAVCAAEAYLLEWVRDDVLSRDFDALNIYFPANRRLGIVDRWKEVTKRLNADGKIKANPTWGGREWQDFVELVDYRNGLVHAKSSRPETTGLATGEMPFPTVAQLSSRPPGWATKTLLTLIEHVHCAVGTDAPAWLQAP